MTIATPAREKACAHMQRGPFVAHEEGVPQLPYMIGIVANGIFNAVTLTICNYLTLAMAAVQF